MKISAIEKEYVEGLRIADKVERKFLDQFYKNPNCHFWIAREGKDICALLIGELKYGKLEIFRLCGKEEPIVDADILMELARIIHSELRSNS